MITFIQCLAAGALITTIVSIASPKFPLFVPMLCASLALVLTVFK